MLAIGLYILNLNYWVFKLIKLGIYGLLSIDLLNNLKYFNLENVFIILLAFIILEAPNIIKLYFRRKFYYA